MSRRLHGIRRLGKIKIDHRITEGLRTILEEIETWTEITTIIPGVIKKSGSHHEMRLAVQYQTKTGLKIIGKGFGAVQEVFLVTSQPDIVEQKIKQR